MHVTQMGLDAIRNPERLRLPVEFLYVGWMVIDRNICTGVFCAMTRASRPVPQPGFSTRICAPIPGTSKRARNVLAGSPGPCRGNPVNISKNNMVILS